MSFGRDIRKTLALAWPIMGAQVLWLSMAFVDNVMVGRLGVEPLASLAMAAGFFAVVFLACTGLLSAVSPLVAEAEGRGHGEEIGVLAGQGLRLSLLASAITLLLFGTAGDLLVALGQNPLLIDDAEAYLLALAWGVPAQNAFTALRQVTEGVGDTKPSVLFAGVSAGLNIPLDYALIHGAWGFPQLGVAGAGYATALVSWMAFLGLLLYTLKRRRYQRYAMAAGLRRTDRVVLKRVLSLGVPLGAAIVSEVAFFASATLMAGTLGTVQLAAHQIALNAASFTFMAPLGLSIAVAIRIGQAVGRRDVGALRTAALAGIVVTLGLQVLAAAVFLLLPEVIASVYTEEAQLRAVATRLLVIAGIFQIFDGLQVVGLGQMRGIKQTRAPFVVTLLAFWGLGAPVGYACAVFWGLGVDGLWYGLLAGLGVAAALHQLRFWKVYRRSVLR